MPARSLLIALATGLTALVCAAPASAYVYSTSNGSPGRITHAPPLYVADFNSAYGPLLTFGTETGAVVMRSPRTTGAQYVAMVYSLQKWSGSYWYEIQQRSSQGWIARTQSSIRFQR